MQNLERTSLQVYHLHPPHFLGKRINENEGDILFPRFMLHLIRFSAIHSHWPSWCFPRNLLHTSLNAYETDSSSTFIVTSKFSLSQSLRIWGPKTILYFILASLILWKITLRYCFSAFLNCFIKNSWICSCNIIIFSFLTSYWWVTQWDSSIIVPILNVFWFGYTIS